MPSPPEAHIGHCPNCDPSRKKCRWKRFLHRLLTCCCCCCFDDMAPARISPPSTPIKEVKSNDLQHGSPTSLLAMPAMRRNPSYTISSKKPTDVAADSSSMYFIRNTVQSLEKKGAADLGYGVFESVSNTTYINLVEYIANERLSSLPHRGSTW